MKMKRDHLVPLVPRALELIEMMEQHRKTGAEYVFPGAKPGMPMSENTKCKAVQSLGVNSTAHGFRSTFKDWARAAQWEDYLSEFQLAHIDDNKSREPYGRDGQLALRREMMTEWAGYIAGTIDAPNWERQADRGNLRLVGSNHVRHGGSVRTAGASKIVPLPKPARRRV
jgi:integrase